MFGAVGAGVRYLANAPALQVTCWRTFLFALPAGGLSGLLPLFAEKTSVPVQRRTRYRR
jgi:hypothetical protein